MVNVSRLHYNAIQLESDAFSSINLKSARNCLMYMLDYIIVIKMRRFALTKGYW